MHENIKKMCDGYKCISGHAPATESERQAKLTQLREVIAEVREDWLSIPLGIENQEQKTRLYKKLRHLMSKERVLLDQS